MTGLVTGVGLRSSMGDASLGSRNERVHSHACLAMPTLAAASTASALTATSEGHAYPT
jgi:hypothetical protein